MDYSNPIFEPLHRLLPAGEPDPVIWQAFCFAEEAHYGQQRKYTFEPYIHHPVDVASIVSCVTQAPELLAIALMHDVIEDCGVTHADIESAFDSYIADGVIHLSDQCTEGNRAKRKADEAKRLGSIPGDIQTIKIADMISNTSSIVANDTDFAKVYLHEKERLLAELTGAHWIMQKLGRYSLAKAQADLGKALLQKELELRYGK